MRHFRAVLTVAIALAVVLVGCDPGPEVRSGSTPSEEDGVAGDQGTRGTTAKVRLRPPEPGDSDIEGLLTITDDGAKVRVTGSAQGFDPDKNYISLFHGVGSTATGPRACEPVGIPSSPGDPENALRRDQMHVGGWAIRSLDMGGLRALAWPKLYEGSTAGKGYSGEYELKNAPPELEGSTPSDGVPDYVPLDRVGTVSIRTLSETDALGRVGFGPDAVVACGDVEV